MPANRKSQSVHDLHGTVPNGRAADVSHVASGRPKFFRDLDSSLRPVFKRLCALLADRRVLTRGDAELIRLYCFQFDRHTRNAAALRDEGEVVTYFRLDSHGQSVPQVKTNLRLKIVVEAEKQMAGILNQLGLTPTAKDRAKPTSSNEDKIVPGSIQDLMPHLLTKKQSAVVEFVPPNVDLSGSLDEPQENDDARIR
jgi:P27 family predicted phage terminase small subunit